MEEEKEEETKEEEKTKEEEEVKETKEEEEKKEEEEGELLLINRRIELLTNIVCKIERDEL